MSPSATLTLSAVTVAALAAACGGRHIATAPQVPAADIPAATVVQDLKGPSLDAYIEHLRELSGKARPRMMRTGMATVENTNPELGAALGALALFPSAQRHISVAEAYRHANILDKAHEHLALAARMDSRNARAYDGMARIWREWGFANLGLADAHRAVYYAPASPETHNTLGTLLQALGSHNLARIEYEKVLQLNPRAAYAINNICTLDLLAGNAAAAALRCEDAVRLDPDLTVASRNLEQARAILRANAVEAPDGHN